ncbi:hypothetical protein CIPAW_05G210100 [Carya illinoinensis]|uniref:Autophagy-related protein 13 N-terminal domain-containing protein n=1 Tax=Carya illinoinensis TaxID=32201 RepID=A0A8T1QLL4_CARIL|nr:hypothetical protein CIPAW_05G210100 [Carya illinoinensis]
MDLQGNSQPESGKLEQIVSQFLLKSLHIILDSRVASRHPHGCSGDLSSASRVRNSDIWFNLVLGDRPAALDNLNFWPRNMMDPMIIDVILVHEVIERWVVRYEYPRVVAAQTAENQVRLIMWRPSFGDPFSRVDKEMMEEHSFNHVEAFPSCLCISMACRKTLTNFNFEPSTTLPPKIITDYVGSPNTDPLRSFPSSEKGIHAISFPLRGVRAPSPMPFQRPHRWTIPNYRMSIYQRTISYDDYQLSPPFSPSLSSSSLSYISTGNPKRTRVRPETTHVSIPHSMASRNSRYLSPNSYDPSRSSLPPLSPRSRKTEPSSQESPYGTTSFRKIESLRSGEMQNRYASQKIIRDSKDDSGRFSGFFSSSGSPRIGFSISSSRLSFQDDLDDNVFSCPFDVDALDIQSLPIVKKSQDAAVGVLVHMLRTAPPLRQDSSCYSYHSMKTELEGGVPTASRFFMPRKSADALEEFRSFREMKDLLLSKSGTRVVSKDDV